MVVAVYFCGEPRTRRNRSAARRPVLSNAEPLARYIATPLGPASSNVLRTRSARSSSMLLPRDLAAADHRMVEAPWVVVKRGQVATLGARVALGNRMIRIAAHAHDPLAFERDEDAAHGVADPAEAGLLDRLARELAHAGILPASAPEFPLEFPLIGVRRLSRGCSDGAHGCDTRHAIRFWLLAQELHMSYSLGNRSGRVLAAGLGVPAGADAGVRLRPLEFQDATDQQRPVVRRRVSSASRVPAPARRLRHAEGHLRSGSAKGATARGVTDTEIHIGVTADPGAAAAPGLEQEFFDTAEGFSKWCNAAGGINGRKIVVDKLDAKLFNVGQVMTQACQKDFMLVGNGNAFDSAGVKIREACGLGQIPGLRDLAAGGRRDPAGAGIADPVRPRSTTVACGCSSAPTRRRRPAAWPSAAARSRRSSRPA